MDLFTEREYEVMKRYGSAIHKVYVGIVGEGVMDQLDGMAVMLCGGERFWMKKITFVGRSVCMELMVWGTEEGMTEWYRDHPGDVRFAVKGFE